MEAERSRPASKGTIRTRATYLEMAGLPPAFVSVTPTSAAVEIRRVERPEVAFYRSLYDGVGGLYTWTARKLMGDEELAAIIHNPAVEVHVLYVGGAPAGFVEFDCRRPPDVEISMFGIFPEHHGRRLGPHLLNWAVGHAWSEKRPRRLWLHTCTLDHPKALSMYLKAGFSKYQERDEFVALV